MIKGYVRLSLTQAVLHTHNSKAHFSLPHNSYTHSSRQLSFLISSNLGCLLWFISETCHNAQVSPGQP